MIRLLNQLRRSDDGSVAIEFALAGPVLIAMMMGILQFGIGMQNYNALRGISSDVARYAVVNYQTKNRLTAAQLETYANGIASRAPYGMIVQNFESQVTTAATQRVTGATEFTIELSYRVPTFLGFIGLGEIPLTYSRPIFVVNS